MAKGIGNDIIEIDRIKRAIQNHGAHFLNKLFTKKEQEYCQQSKNPYPRFAGRFAAKEAISKALGTGFGEHLSWLDLEILNDSQGKPCVCINNNTFKDSKILLSISHCKLYAIATAILN